MKKGISLEEIRAADAPTRIIMNSLFDGVYIVDRERKIVLWNHGAELITGFKEAEVTGKRCSDNILNHIDAEGKPLCGARCPLQHCLDTGEGTTAKIYPLHKSGRRFPVDTHITPLRDEAGDIVAGIEVFRDVSTEEAYRILQEKFNKLVQQYVSRATYEEIRAQADSNRAAHVQSRDLTILYLDIVGFTAMSENQPPVAVVQLLNEVFGICDVITREKHGDIDKFIGDAIMAVFVDAGDAVEAAAQILNEALPHYNAQRQEEGMIPVRVRIGINSGTVLQGDIGTTDRKELTVIGDVVNVAQRIESIAPANAMYLSEAAYARLPESISKQCCFMDEVAVKGRVEPIRVFSLQ